MHARRISAILSVLLLFPHAAAALSIREVMYDLPGTDTGREWIEVYNDGSAALDLTKIKFFEANTNHGVATTSPAQDPTLGVGSYAVIADVPAKFLADWPGFSGALFDSSFSLSNSGETLALKDGGTVLDEIAYVSASGAAGDGSSLSRDGTGWYAAAPTPGSGSGAASGGAPAAASSSTPSGGASGDTATTSANAAESGAEESGGSSASGSGSVSFPTEPTITARIRGGGTVLVGADAMFRAEALGLEGKPLGNGRYLWNFGDGGTAAGERVTHSYNFPGRYVVVLDAASSGWSVTARETVTAVVPRLSISSSDAHAVTLQNQSERDLDLSGWIIKSGEKEFRLPDHSVILSGAGVAFSEMVLGWSPAAGEAALLYPNGIRFATFAAEKKTQAAPPVPLPAGAEKKTAPPPRDRVLFVSPASGSGTGTLPALVIGADAENGPERPFAPLFRWGGLALFVTLLGAGGGFLIRRRAPPRDEITIIE